jgi:hypothetical protein
LVHAQARDGAPVAGSNDSGGNALEEELRLPIGSEVELIRAKVELADKGLATEKGKAICIVNGSMQSVPN